MATAKLSTLLVAKDLTRGAFRTFTRSLGMAKKALFNFKTGLIALVGIAGLGLLIKRTLEAVDANKKIADRIGLTTKQLGGFELAAALAGERIEKVQSMFEKMEKNLGEAQMGLGTAKNALLALGLSVEKLNRLSPDARFKLLADEVKNLTTQQQKATIAFQLFGKGGLAMIQVLEMGSKKLSEMQDDAVLFGVALNEKASSAIEAFNDKLYILKTIGSGVFRTFLVGMIPAMTALVDLATKWALSWTKDGGPQRFADSLVSAITMLAHQFVNAIEGIVTLIRWGGELTNSLSWLFDEKPVKDSFFDKLDTMGEKLEGWRAGIDSVDVSARMLLATTKEQAEVIEKNYTALTKNSVLNISSLNKLQEKLEDINTIAFDHATAFAKSFGKAFEDIIWGTKKLGQAFNDLGRQILAAMINMFITKAILGPIMAPFTSFMEGMFPPPKALGGAVKAGGKFLVGERGPEILTMGRQSGTISPNSALGGINQTINITTGIQSTVRAEILGLLPAIAAASQGHIIDSRMRGVFV